MRSSYGKQKVAEFLDGEIPLSALYTWADAFGVSPGSFDPRDTESLSIALVLLGCKSRLTPEREVRAVLEAIDASETGAML